MKGITRAGFFGLALMAFSALAAQSSEQPSLNKKETQWLSEWEAKGEDPRISAECRQHSSNINQCRFRMVSDVPLDALGAVILDVDHFTEWAKSVSESRRVFTEESGEGIYVYTTYDFVGAYDRDAVSVYTPDYRPDEQRIRITFQTVKRDVPVTDFRLVRFPLMAGYWQFTRLENGQTEIEHQSFAMPGGVVQKALYYLYNTAYVDASFETLRALENQARKPKYRERSLATLMSGD